MFRLSTFVTCILLTSPCSIFCGNLPTVLTPFTLNPSVEILRSPVQRVETINITPTYTKSFGGSAAAVAVAGNTVSSVPVVQRIESYSSGDSSNSEIRDLLRSLLSELRSSKSVTTLSAPLVKSSYGPPPSDSYGPPSDSYAAPPRNTYTDPGAPSYPDSSDSGFRKPEKVVVLEERQPILTAPVTAAVAQVQTAPVAVKEVVRTVYQPVYVPVQYTQPQEQLGWGQPQSYVSAVPTTINTGVSAVAYSQIHSQPAYAIQQEQYSIPVAQQVVQTYAKQQTAVLDTSSNGGYQKKK